MTLKMKKHGFTKFWIIITAAFLLVGLFFTAWYITLEATEKEMLTRFNQQQFLLVAGTAIGVEGLFDDLSASLRALVLLPEKDSCPVPSTLNKRTRRLLLWLIYPEILKYCLMFRIFPLQHF